jgi:hypothetical protein
MAEENPLQKYLRVQNRFDRMIATILKDAANEAAKTVIELGAKGNFSAAIERERMRMVEMELRQQSEDYWNGIRTAMERSYVDAASAAADAVATEDAVLWRSVGLSMPQYNGAMLVQAVNNVPTLIARGMNGVPLAQSVYGTRNLADGYVDRVINRGILLGKSARQIANDVKGLIRPDVRGGVSYAAYRLGRTELNNAFHRTQTDLAAAEPWVTGMQWHLSRSHPKADECNEYANETHYRGGSPGVFPAGDVPPKPHPQCLCFITNVQVDEDEFIESLVNGDYDDYLNGTMNVLPADRHETGMAKVLRFRQSRTD